MPKEFQDWQLGHVQGGAQTTTGYGTFPKGYGEEATRALDAWIARVRILAARKPKAGLKKAA